jgi:hypothetical protein
MKYTLRRRTRTASTWSIECLEIELDNAVAFRPADLARRIAEARAALGPADRKTAEEPVSPALDRRLAELADNHAPVIATDPDPVPPPATRDGRWLYNHIRSDRAALGQAIAFGGDHGYPRRMVDWSPIMVSSALAAVPHTNGAPS